jgi:hypothetical protein
MEDMVPTDYFTADEFEETDSEPDTSERDTSERDTSERDTSERDTSEPDTSEPDTSKPDTSKPDTSEPDTTPLPTPLPTPTADLSWVRTAFLSPSTRRPASRSGNSSGVVKKAVPDPSSNIPAIVLTSPPSSPPSVPAQPPPSAPDLPPPDSDSSDESPTTRVLRAKVAMLTAERTYLQSQLNSLKQDAVRGTAVNTTRVHLGMAVEAGRRHAAELRAAALQLQVEELRAHIATFRRGRWGRAFFEQVGSWRRRP